MSLLILIIAVTVLTGLGWALATWARADTFHPRPRIQQWFD